MKNRTRDYYRYQRNMHIRRKKGIIKRYNQETFFYKVEGKLSKGKIHCSCWMCRFHGPSASDMRKTEKLNQMEQEYCTKM